MISVVLVVQDQLNIQIKEIKRQLKERKQQKSLNYDNTENIINSLSEKDKNLFELIIKLSY